MMLLKEPIEIDFLALFRTGKFDYLKPGQTKEWILNNFPDPDTLDHASNIWQYGNIELHFHEDKLYLIFSDYLHELDGGKFLKLDKWILNNPERLTLKYVIEKLNDEKIDFTKKHGKTPGDVICLELTDSTVSLGFIDDDEATVNPNLYMLNSFSLMKQLW